MIHISSVNRLRDALAKDYCVNDIPAIKSKVEENNVAKSMLIQEPNIDVGNLIVTEYKSSEDLGGIDIKNEITGEIYNCKSVSYERRDSDNFSGPKKYCADFLIFYDHCLIINNMIIFPEHFYCICRDKYNEIVKDLKADFDDKGNEYYIINKNSIINNSKIYNFINRAIRF